MHTLDALVRHLSADLRRDGRYHADCPFCGKEAKRGQKHFSFVEAGYVCWVCSAQGGIVALAQHCAVRGDANSPRAPQKPAQPTVPRQWQTDPLAYVQRFCEAPTRLQDWQGYKPLTIDTIARYRLGVGVLPSSRCQVRRLIVPVFAAGRVVAFHGRAYMPGDADAKWLTSGGSRKDVLFNSDSIQPGATVVICENMIDALLAQQAEPVVGVAGGGVAWNDEWTHQIAAQRPKHVLVWLDNDLAGCPNPETYHEALRLWHQTMRQRVAAGKIPRIPTPPEPRGPKIANALLAAGVKATAYRWPNGTPIKADLGSVLATEPTP